MGRLRQRIGQYLDLLMPWWWSRATFAPPPPPPAPDMQPAPPWMEAHFAEARKMRALLENAPGRVVDVGTQGAPGEDLWAPRPQVIHRVQKSNGMLATPPRRR